LPFVVGFIFVAVELIVLGRGLISAQPNSD
jgi:hypothetical protein